MTDTEALPEPAQRQRDWLLVSETFTSVQGEGPRSGVPAFFIRLGGCNLHCKWCDTPYTWVFTDRQVAQHQLSLAPFQPDEELSRLSLYEATSRVFGSDCRLVVLTGGEPLLQLAPLASLISACNEYPQRNLHFEIETAGTIHPGELTAFENVTFNVSPKLEHSGNFAELRRVPTALAALAAAPRAVFKFVVSLAVDPEDQLTEIASMIAEYRIPLERVWLMPCGTTEGELAEGLKYWTPRVVRLGWNITSRLQIVAFGDTRAT